MSTPRSTTSRHDGALERASPQDSHLRLARGRDRPVRVQRHCHPAKTDRLRDVGPRRIGTRGHDPLPGLQAARRRKRPDPEPGAEGILTGLQGGHRIGDRRPRGASPGRQVESLFDVEENSGLISADQHSALVPVEIKALADDAADKVHPIVDRVAEIQANPDFTIGSFGESTEKAVFVMFMDHLLKAGAFSISLTLIISWSRSARSLWLGSLPGGVVGGARDLRPRRADQQRPADVRGVGAIVLLIGLAVGVDDTMFSLKREREERAAGRSEEAALQAAAATSGRAVLISGCTVLVAMAGMFLTGDPGFASFGIATMTVVAVAMLGSLTVLPALLSKLGDNVDRVRVPFVHRLRRDDGGGRSGARSSIASSGARLFRPSWPAGSSGARGAGVPAAHRSAEHRHLSPEPADDLQPPQGGLPRDRCRGERGREGAEHRGAGRSRGNRSAQVARDRQRRHERAHRRRRQRRGDGREHQHPRRRRRHGLHIEPGARRSPRRDRPANGGHARKRRGRCHRNDGSGQGLQRPDEVLCAARLRVRVAVRIRA